MESQQFLDDPYGQQQFLDDTYSQQNIDINKNGVFLFAGSFLALAGLVGLWRNIDNVKSTLASIKEHFKRNKEEKKEEKKEDKKEEQKDTKKPTIYDLLLKSAKNGGTAESIQAIIKAFSDEESSSHMRDSEVVKSMVSLRKFSGILPSELTSNNVTELVKSISTLREKLVDRGFDKIETVHLADACAILTKASLKTTDLKKAKALLDNVNQVAFHADITTLVTHLTTMKGLLDTFQDSPFDTEEERLRRLNAIATNANVGSAFKDAIKEILDEGIEKSDIRGQDGIRLKSLDVNTPAAFASYFHATAGSNRNEDAHALSFNHINSLRGQSRTNAQNAEVLKEKILNLKTEEIAQRMTKHLSESVKALLIKQTTAILKEIPMLKTQQQKNAAQPKNTVNNANTVINSIQLACLGLNTTDGEAVTAQEVTLLDNLCTSVADYLADEAAVELTGAQQRHHRAVSTAYTALINDAEFNKREGVNVMRAGAGAAEVKKQMIELCRLISLYSESNK